MRSRRRALSLMLIAGAMLLVMACGDDSPAEGGQGSASPTPSGAQAAATSAPQAHEPVIYLAPSAGSVQGRFVFSGSGFEPRAPITVSFLAPTRDTIALASNPLVSGDDGTVHLTIVPMNDLTDQPGNPHSVPTGRWIATFTLSAATYYQQEFEVEH